MLGKLIALLAHAKGAAVATVLVVGAAGATVASSNTEVQNTFTNVTTALNTTVAAVTRNAASCTGDNHGAEQVAIVQQRNSADKLLRDAWGEDHKALEDLRGGGQDVDAKAVGDVIKNYDSQLRDRLDAALIKVASVTLGRQGQVRKAEASASTSPSPKPSCSPKPSDAAAAAATPKPSPSAKPSGSGKPDDQGRVAVALRTTLDPDIQTMVDDAIKDMKDLVTKATDEAAKLPAPVRGKPSDQPGGKPSDNPGNKPSNAPGKP